MIPNECIEVQTSPLDRASVPAWFAEVVMIARHLATKGLFEAFAQQVRLVRGRFGSGSTHRFSRTVDRLCHQRGTDPGRLL
jgi:hypothetical protein